MELYLLRHGIAAEKGANYPIDSERPLTKKGRKELRQVARGMCVLGLKFDLIFTRANEFQ
jgi:phosphohistidine phosphatase SixA